VVGVMPYAYHSYEGGGLQTKAAAFMFSHVAPLVTLPFSRLIVIRCFLFFVENHNSCRCSVEYYLG
jgi:hypothetical protein